MKYLVCVDGSENADAAFQRAVSLYVEKRDELYILFVAFSDQDIWASDIDKKMKERSVIQKYANICSEYHINSKLVTEAPHAGSVGEHIIEKGNKTRVTVTTPLVTLHPSYALSSILRTTPYTHVLLVPKFWGRVSLTNTQHQPTTQRNVRHC
jgi:hypothetical protein